MSNQEPHRHRSLRFSVGLILKLLTSMITTHIIHPVQPDGTQEYLVEITERVCRKYCQNASVLPTAAVTFEVGPTVTVGENIAKATVTARVSIMTPKCQQCGCATPQIYTERFDVAFPVTGNNRITIVPGAQVIVEPAYKGCCSARGVKITTSLEADIA